MIWFILILCIVVQGSDRQGENSSWTNEAPVKETTKVVFSNLTKEPSKMTNYEANNKSSDNLFSNLKLETTDEPVFSLSVVHSTSNFLITTEDSKNSITRKSFPNESVKDFRSQNSQSSRANKLPLELQVNFQYDDLMDEAATIFINDTKENHVRTSKLTLSSYATHIKKHLQHLPEELQVNFHYGDVKNTHNIPDEPQRIVPKSSFVRQPLKITKAMMKNNKLNRPSSEESSSHLKHESNPDWETRPPLQAQRSEFRSDGTKLSAEYRLVRDLFQFYNKQIRPTEVAGEVTHVFFQLSIFNVLQMDTKNQILKTNTEMIFKWVDYHLKWDPEKYENISIIRVPYQDIWIPDVILYNTAEADYDATVLRTNAILTSSGIVELVSHTIFSTVCNVDIQWYPFDQQECVMTFASWTYDEVSIQLVVGPADISDFQQNPAFFLEDFFAVQLRAFNPCCVYPMSSVEFHVQLQRRTKFALFFYIMPGILINLCAVMVFSLPAESGEKIGLGINAMLAMIVFLMAMTENLPPTQKIPLAGMYYGVCLSFITANIAFSVFSLNINISGERNREVGLWLRSFIIGLTKVLGNRIPDLVQVKWNINEGNPFGQNVVNPKLEKDLTKSDLDFEADIGNHEKNSYNDFKDSFQRRVVQALEKMAHVTEKQSKLNLAEQRKEILRAEWKFVSRVIDRFLFIVFSLITFIFNLTILTSSPFGEIFEYCPTGHGTCKGMTDEEIMILTREMAHSVALDGSH